MAETQRVRGRPLGPFSAAVAATDAERLVKLARCAECINGDVITPQKMASVNIRKTRREIFQHYQPEGSAVANETRADERIKRLALIEAALNDQSRNLRRLSNIRAADILAGEFGLSLHTLRKDVAEIRKLT